MFELFGGNILMSFSETPTRESWGMDRDEGKYVSRSVKPELTK